jgi:hypothetical protein
MSDGLVRVRPVLFCAPVWWTSEFWDESAHATDWVRPETPLDDRPSAVIEVSLDAKLGEVLGVACGAWGLRLGRDNLRRGRTIVERECARFGFVRSDRDVAGLTPQDGLRWPQTLPVAREDGSIQRVSGRDVSLRQLLVSSDLGLITGDVTRPYVHPVRPQGDPALVGAIAQLTAEAVHAAYAAVDARIGVAELSSASSPPLCRRSSSPETM